MVSSSISKYDKRLSEVSEKQKSGDNHIEQEKQKGKDSKDIFAQASELAKNEKRQALSVEDIKAIVVDIQIAGLDKKALVQLAKKYAQRGIIRDIGMFVDLAYRYNKARAQKIAGENISRSSGQISGELAKHTKEYREFILASENLEGAKRSKDLASRLAVGVQSGGLQTANERIKSTNASIAQYEQDFLNAQERYKKVNMLCSIFGVDASKGRAQAEFWLGSGIDDSGLNPRKSSRFPNNTKSKKSMSLVFDDSSFLDFDSEGYDWKAKMRRILNAHLTPIEVEQYNFS